MNKPQILKKAFDIEIREGFTSSAMTRPYHVNTTTSRCEFGVSALVESVNHVLTQHGNIFLVQRQPAITFFQGHPTKIDSRQCVSLINILWVRAKTVSTIIIIQLGIYRFAKRHTANQPFGEDLRLGVIVFAF